MKILEVVRTFRASVFVLSILAAAVASCNHITNPSVIVPADSRPRIVVVQVSQDAPPINVRFDTALQGNGLLFTASTGYVRLAAGSRAISVDTLGSLIPVLSEVVSLAANSSTSAFLADSIARISLLILPDTLTSPTGGKASVRFLNLSPDSRAAYPTRGGIGSSDRFSSALHFKEFSSLVLVDANQNTFKFRDETSGDVLVDIPGLASGSVNTVYVCGERLSSGPARLTVRILRHN